MLSKLFSAALLATSFMYTDAACNFRSRALIFPDCNDGATDTACPFQISENTPDGSNDDIVHVTISWNDAMPGVDDNKYFLLDRASSDTGTYNESYSVTYNPNPASPTHLDESGSVYKTFALQRPDSTDCSDEGCQVHYDVSLMIGAAPACTGFDDAAHIYTRAVYKFRITQQWIRVNGVVDFTDWSDVRTESSFITQADETKAIVNYEAENVQVVDEFELKSHLDIVNKADDSASSGICLGDSDGSVSASFSDTQGLNTVSNDNGLGLCDARAMAYIVQQDPASNTVSTAGYEDTDTQATNHLDYNDNGYVAISLSQYSQINATKSDGFETANPEVPGTFSVDDDQHAKASAGDDYRWDIATATSQANGTRGSDPAQVVVIDSGVAHDSNNFHGECLDGTHSFGVTSVANSGSDRVRALAALRYTLIAPSTPAEAAQTPIIYVGAWYTHSIPTEDEYNVDHDDYDSSLGGDYTPSRRLLRSAATKKLKAPKVASRVHLLRVHLQH